MSNSVGADQSQARRQEAMRILAGTPSADLKHIFEQSGLPADATTLRGPETGLVTVRGRMGCGGSPFNVGEATVTRATVKLATGEVGHAYLLGRDGERARIAAMVDALIQRAETGDIVEREMLAPLREANVARAAQKRAETAATKVDFFTMVRGED